MTIRLIQVDAFTDKPFAGNPAAVCLLEDEGDSRWMQAVAAEMNLSETAFVRKLPEGYELRWFTPQLEVDLCGHATLASAHVLWTEGSVAEEEQIRFHTRSGVLTAANSGNLIEMDFPATQPSPCQAPAGLIEALGVEPSFVGKSKYDSFVVLASEKLLRALTPDFGLLAKIETRGIIVTSPSDTGEYDFVSRFFAPAVGVNEDPVTGSAHCSLAPYWSKLLGKSTMIAYQASQRGGIVRVTVVGERVLLAGNAVTVLRGELVSGKW